MTVEAIHAAPKAVSDALRKPALLIADDDAAVRSLLALQLAPHFDLIGSARDADEAITLAESHQPALALLDVQMPGGGGLTATREIHARAPEIAIVALSADESDSVVLAMLEAGAVTYVRKGRPAQELIRLLKESIAAHAKLSAGAAG
jgi:DNA-binding NarL/FixJ family response regulator